VRRVGKSGRMDEFHIMMATFPMMVTVSTATTGEQPPVANDARIVTHLTTSGGTPLPAELSLPPMPDMGTGNVYLAPDAGDLVGASLDCIRATAVLTIDPKAEALVDRLLSERVVGTKVKRRLARKNSGGSASRPTDDGHRSTTQRQRPATRIASR